MVICALIYLMLNWLEMQHVCAIKWCWWSQNIYVWNDFRQKDKKNILKIKYQKHLIIYNLMDTSVDVFRKFKIIVWIERKWSLQMFLIVNRCVICIFIISKVFLFSIKVMKLSGPIKIFTSSSSSTSSSFYSFKEMKKGSTKL